MSQSKKASLILCIAVFSFLALVNGNGNEFHAGKLEIEIYFCHFELPEKTKEINASFSVIYSFLIDDDGKPYEFEALRDDFVGEKIVRSCLEKWRLHGLEGRPRIVMSANWQHGVGWVSMSVVGKGIEQRIGRFGELSPYPSCQEP